MAAMGAVVAGLVVGVGIGIGVAAHQQWKKGSGDFAYVLDAV